MLQVTGRPTKIIGGVKRAENYKCLEQSKQDFLRTHVQSIAVSLKKQNWGRGNTKRNPVKTHQEINIQYWTASK